jgi:hypothetical protein
VLWSIWWRLLRKVGAHPPIEINGWLADQLLSNRIPPSTIFHGMTANARIESQFTLNHYNQHQISSYRSLANERRLEIEENA